MPRGLQCPRVLPFHHLVNQAHHLTGLHMSLSFELREDQLAVDSDLKAAAVRWHEREALDHMLKLLQQLTCQAHGPVGVVSDCTVDNLNLQHGPSRLARNWPLNGVGNDRIRQQC
jgi:hypothetical protein